VRRLTELLGGSVAVESSPGAGATFLVELPVTHPGARPGVAATSAPESPA
jgi:signal transduction histidine kinase